MHECDCQKKIVIWQIVSQYGLGDEKKAVLRYSLAVLGLFTWKTPATEFVDL